MINILKKEYFVRVKYKLDGNDFYYNGSGWCWIWEPLSLKASRHVENNILCGATDIDIITIARL